MKKLWNVAIINWIQLNPYNVFNSILIKFQSCKSVQNQQFLVSIFTRKCIVYIETWKKIEKWPTVRHFNIFYYVNLTFFVNIIANKNNKSNGKIEPEPMDIDEGSTEEKNNSHRKNESKSKTFVCLGVHSRTKKEKKTKNSVIRLKCVFY